MLYELCSTNVLCLIPLPSADTSATSENASQKHVTSATKKCNKNKNSDGIHKTDSSQGMSVTKAQSSGNDNPDSKSSAEDKSKKGDNESGNNISTVNNNNAHQVIASQSLPHQPSCDSNQSSVPEDRLAELRSFPYYQLYVHLKQGHDLPAKDSCGTSDPYVKFSWKGKPVYKSKTIYKDLNPFWDEAFILTLDDPLQALELKVRIAYLLLKIRKTIRYLYLYTYIIKIDLIFQFE